MDNGDQVAASLAASPIIVTTPLFLGACLALDVEDEHHTKWSDVDKQAFLLMLKDIIWWMQEVNCESYASSGAEVSSVRMHQHKQAKEYQ